MQRINSFTCDAVLKYPAAQFSPRFIYKKTMIEVCP